MIDPLMTRLAEAARLALEHSDGLSLNDHRSINEAIIAYDERVTAADPLTADRFISDFSPFARGKSAQADAAVVADLMSPAHPEPSQFKPGDRVVLARPDRFDREHRRLQAGIAGTILEVDHNGWPNVRLDGERKSGHLFEPKQLEPEPAAITAGPGCQPYTGPDRLDYVPATDTAVLARLDALEARVAALAAPAKAAPWGGVPVTPVPRPSVGRRVRCLHGSIGYFRKGEETTLVAYVGLGSGPARADGSDRDGMWWGKPIDPNRGLGTGTDICIGKPGIDFEFID